MIRGKAWKVHSMFLAVLLFCTMACNLDHESKGLSPDLSSSASSKILSKLGIHKIRLLMVTQVSRKASVTFQRVECGNPASLGATKLGKCLPTTKVLVRVFSEHHGNLPSRMILLIIQYYVLIFILYKLSSFAPEGLVLFGGGLVVLSILLAKGFSASGVTVPLSTMGVPK